MSRFQEPDPESTRQRLAEIGAEEGSRRRIVPWSVCAIMASIAVSLLLMGWGFSMEDVNLGPTIFFIGALVGNIGIVVTLLWAYRTSRCP